MGKKRAFITGISGQDGAYLAKHLLDLGYDVVGGARRSASDNMWRLRELGIDTKIKLVPFELLEFSSILSVLQKEKPDEFYNLAAQSFVGTSFSQPLYTSEVDAMGVLRVLEAIKTVSPETRFYQASTSEMFGKIQEDIQSEGTAFHPRSPYGVAKLFGHWITINYREAYGLHGSSGILFNHESPLRGEEFVTRKITLSLARIKAGLQDTLVLGNLDSTRDWGFAGDYVKGMHLMLQQPEGGEYVLATGETHSIRKFVETAAPHFGYDITWEGEGVKTVGIDKKSGKTLVRVSPEFYRPSEVDVLIGSPAKAQEELGWRPEVSFDALVEMMAKADLQRVMR